MLPLAVEAQVWCLSSALSSVPVGLFRRLQDFELKVTFPLSTTLHSVSLLSWVDGPGHWQVSRMSMPVVQRFQWLRRAALPVRTYESGLQTFKLASLAARGQAQ